jgi:hypothetical protein
MTQGTITGTPAPGWLPQYLVYHKHLARRGYTVRYQGNAVFLTPPPQPQRAEPPRSRYTGKPMVKATWAPPGMTIWVPDVATEPDS